MITNNIQNKKKISDNKFIANEKIKSRNVILVDYEGEKPKTLILKDALHIAKTNGLDLIQLGFDKQQCIPICKIADLGKLKYEMSKKEKLKKKAQKESTPEIKQIQFTLTTDTNDLSRLSKHAREFIEDGDRVRLVLRFRNFRESNKKDMAKASMDDFLNTILDISEIDSEPKFLGKEYSCILKKRKTNK